MEPIEVELLDRELTLGEIIMVSSELMEYLKTQVDHPLYNVPTLDGVIKFFNELQAAGCLDVYAYQGRIIGVLGYHVAPVMWSTRKCLQEMIVFQVNKQFKGFGRVALERLNELAVLNDCSVIAAGSLINMDPQMTTNLYMKKGGFTFSYPCFVKVL